MTASIRRRRANLPAMHPRIACILLAALLAPFPAFSSPKKPVSAPSTPAPSFSSCSDAADTLPSAPPSKGKPSGRTAPPTPPPGSAPAKARSPAAHAPSDKKPGCSEPEPLGGDPLLDALLPPKPNR